MKKTPHNFQRMWIYTYKGKNPPNGKWLFLGEESSCYGDANDKESAYKAWDASLTPREDPLKEMATHSSILAWKKSHGFSTRNLMG